MRGRAGDLERLFHIVKYCRKLRVVKDTVQTYERFIAGKNYEKVDVSAFYIGQIGELAGGLSDEMKETLSDIPWRQIKDMRNQLIHNYGKRRKDTIWGVMLRAENSNVDAELRAELAEETGIIDEEAH